jgi:hypothetical protein
LVTEDPHAVLPSGLVYQRRARCGNAIAASDLDAAGNHGAVEEITLTHESPGRDDDPPH